MGRILENLPEHKYQKEKADVVYFVGCVAAYFPMVHKIPRVLRRSWTGPGSILRFSGERSGAVDSPDRGRLRMRPRR
jgi:hypothetical protein